MVWWKRGNSRLEREAAWKGGRLARMRALRGTTKADIAVTVRRPAPVTDRHADAPWTVDPSAPAQNFQIAFLQSCRIFVLIV